MMINRLIRLVIQREKENEPPSIREINKVNTNEFIRPIRHKHGGCGDPQSSRQKPLHDWGEPM